MDRTDMVEFSYFMEDKIMESLRESQKGCRARTQSLGTVNDNLTLANKFLKILVENYNTINNLRVEFAVGGYSGGYKVPDSTQCVAKYSNDGELIGFKSYRTPVMHSILQIIFNVDTDFMASYVKQEFSFMECDVVVYNAMRGKRVKLALRELPVRY